MRSKQIQSIPPHSNPFHHDHFRMGVRVAPNLVVMYSGHDALDGFILVNPETGARFEVTGWKEENKKPERRKNPSYGDVITIQEFRECCESGGFVDYDGSGQYSDGEYLTSDTYVFPSTFLSGECPPPPGSTCVVWYNK